MNDEIKYRPLMFVREMVHAIEQKRKYITRRSRGLEYINVCPDDWQFVDFQLNSKADRIVAVFVNSKGIEHRIPCPYGKPGDGIYVQETFGKIAANGQTVYAAQYSKEDLKKITSREVLLNNRWKGSMFMSMNDARFRFVISNMRIERWKSITEQESIKEGVLGANTKKGACWKNYIADDYSCNSARDSFVSLIMHLNAKTANSGDIWIRNHWTWVIEWKEIIQQ